MHSMRRLVCTVMLAAGAGGLFPARAAAPPFPLRAVDEAACARMKARHVLSQHAPVRCDRLSIVRFRYVGFDGREHDDGMVMVMSAAAEHVRAIFAALHALRFPIARARLIDAYGGDDAASMRDNNTSEPDRSVFDKCAATGTGCMLGAATRRSGATARSRNTAGGRFPWLPAGFKQEGHIAALRRLLREPP